MSVGSFSIAQVQSLNDPLLHEPVYAAPAAARGGASGKMFGRCSSGDRDDHAAGWVGKGLWNSIHMSSSSPHSSHFQVCAREKFHECSSVPLISCYDASKRDLLI